MATTDRREGYYWVKTFSGEWQPAYWMGDRYAAPWATCWWDKGFAGDAVVEVLGRLEPDTVAELCAALETAVGLMTEILISSICRPPAAIAELRNMLAEVLAKARGEVVEG